MGATAAWGGQPALLQCGPMWAMDGWELQPSSHACLHGQAGQGYTAAALDDGRYDIKHLPAGGLVQLLSTA